MKTQTQEQQIITMMKRPIPKKRVGIIKLKMVREGTALYGTERFHEPKEAADMIRPIFEYTDREMMVVMSLDAAMNPISEALSKIISENVKDSLEYELPEHLPEEKGGDLPLYVMSNTYG